MSLSFHLGSSQAGKLAKGFWKTERMSPSNGKATHHSTQALLESNKENNANSSSNFYLLPTKLFLLGIENATQVLDIYGLAVVMWADHDSLGPLRCWKAQHQSSPFSTNISPVPKHPHHRSSRYRLGGAYQASSQLMSLRCSTSMFTS